MVDESNLEREYIKLLSQLTKQTQLLEKTFSILEQKVFKTNSKYESQISAQEEWTKRVKSDNRTANLFSKVRIEELKQSGVLYKVREAEIKGRKDIAKILAKSRKEGISDHRLRATERVTLEEIHQEGVKRNIIMRKAMQGTSDKFNFITSSLTKGRGLITTFGLLGKGAYNSAVSFKAMKTAQEEFKHASIQGDKTRINETRKTMIQTESDYEGKTAGSKHLKSISEKLANAGKFFENHMTGILIGAGAAGVLIGIIKKAVSVSPMFQQMMKLMNFAVTMILRPIGDFIGFFLRPILILLLRKFILPWFKDAYPALRAAGTATGEIATDWIDDITSGDWARVGTAIAKAFGLGIGAYFSIKVFKAAGKIISNHIKSMLNKIKIPVPSWINKLVIKMPLMPDWVKKLFGMVDDAKSGGGTGEGNGGGNNKGGNGRGATPQGDGTKPKSGGDLFKEKVGSKLQGNKGVISNSGKIITPEENAKKIAEKQAQNVKYNQTATKSDKLLRRVADVFKRKGLLKGIQSLQSVMPKLKFGSEKMASLKALLSVSSIKGIGKGLLGSVLGGSAGAGGLPWIIAENLDHLPPAKEFRLWFQSKMREHLPEIDGTGIDSAIGNWVGNKGISNPISDAIASGVGMFRDFTGLANGGIINEPINGVGLNTGRKYKLGERGSEAVVPLNGKGGMGGGGTTVNINIDNMSGDRNDVEKLRKTILEVLQQTSMSRVRA
jgi:hypothetical protein